MSAARDLRAALVADSVVSTATGGRIIVGRKPQSTGKVNTVTIRQRGGLASRDVSAYQESRLFVRCWGENGAAAASLDQEVRRVAKAYRGTDTARFYVEVLGQDLEDPDTGQPIFDSTYIAQERNAL